jgi:hypothetical protein
VMPFSKPKLWPMGCFGFGLTTVTFVYLDMPEPVRGVAVALYLLVCPGLSLVRLIQLDDRLEELVLAVAISMAASTAVPLIMLYSHAWSPRVGLLLLVAIGALANGLELVGLRVPQRLLRDTQTR